MPSLKAILLILICGVALVGCSAMTPQEFASPAQITASSQADASMVNGCIAWVKEKEAAELKAYESMGSADKAMALMHRETMKMIKNVWGEEEQCKPGTNIWDAYAVYVKETEATKRQYSSDLKSVATVGVVTTGAVKLTDSVMGAVGDRINNSGDNNKLEKTVTNTNTNSANIGEGSSTATNNGGTGGTGGESQGAIDSAAWQECNTSDHVLTTDEVNACLQGYGYNTSIVEGQLYLDGKPYGSNK